MNQDASRWARYRLVNHDIERLRETDPFGLAERFRAAVSLVAWVAISAIELLNYAQALQSAGVLVLQPELSIKTLC
ncbi:hypothetical protein ACFZAE_31595 [Streptomyces scabiei]|uniref:hypothetical protein n=1 Tax=Streptomyces scabiei TaxID=1930 RepID=UPI0036E4556D